MRRLLSAEPQLLYILQAKRFAEADAAVSLTARASVRDRRCRKVDVNISSLLVPNTVDASAG